MTSKTKNQDLGDALTFMGRMRYNTCHEPAVGEWWDDAKTGHLCIDVTSGYEYYVEHGRLGETDWLFHLAQKNWMTPALLIQFSELSDAVRARGGIQS